MSISQASQCTTQMMSSLQVAQWVWENFDLCSGISLLPYSDHVYQQAPYEEIDTQNNTRS